MCIEYELVQIPDHLADYRDDWPGRSYDGVEFALDSEGRKCFVIDACMVDALRAVWAAGYRTSGVCCGHGQTAGGIITIDTEGSGQAHNCTGTHERFKAVHRGEPDSAT